MSYKYNKINLFDNPEKYMYTKFEGKKFITSYIQNRLRILNSLRNSDWHSEKFEDSFKKCSYILHEYFNNKCIDILPDYSNLIIEMSISSDIKDFKIETLKDYEPIDIFNLDKKVETKPLLRNLYYSSLTTNDFKDIDKVWLDKLVQRFEVTKKLYSEYLPGFRKGIGEYREIEFYWFLGMILAISISKSNNLNYLNTLIKICDLITSQSLNTLANELTFAKIYILISSEVLFLNNLMIKKGI
tara:strand:+ start:12928 stop:13656 length:729 start_codon:yes stop_codon:yes gene_type:complete